VKSQNFNILGKLEVFINKGNPDEAGQPVLESIFNVTCPNGDASFGFPFNSMVSTNREDWLYFQHDIVTEIGADFWKDRTGQKILNKR
jgi:hypothetical protein